MGRAVKRVSPTAWIFLGMAAGIALGVAAPEVARNLAPVSNIFLRLIRSIIGYTVFFGRGVRRTRGGRLSTLPSAARLRGRGARFTGFGVMGGVGATKHLTANGSEEAGEEGQKGVSRGDGDLVGGAGGTAMETRTRVRGRGAGVTVGSGRVGRDEEGHRGME